MSRVLRFALPVALLAAVAALPACSRKSSEAQAAEAAQKLLAAVWSGDASAFEAAVDRPAVRADLRRQLAEVAKASTLSVEGGASDAALNRMIGPQAFRLTDPDGAPLAAPPSVPQVLQLIAPLGEDKACIRAAPADRDCRLTFAREAKGWKLVAMTTPAGFSIAVPPAPDAAD
jgi:hypothetical protein